MLTMFAPLPGVGHTFPMVPLAWALRAAGHDVVFAAAGDATRAREAGLPVVDIAPGVSMRTLAVRIAREQPDVAERARAALDDPATGARWLAQVSAYLADDLVAAAERLRPDVIVHSTLHPTAAIAAGVVGAIAVDLRYSLAAEDELVQLVRADVARTAERYPASKLACSGLVVDTVPMQLRRTADEALLMRSVPYHGGAVLPAWSTEPGDRRWIVVTAGTVGIGGQETVRTVVRLAAQLPRTEFVLALPPESSAELNPVPENVRMVGWFPLDRLLASAAGIVHHGGAGTTLSALSAGVPQLIVPEGADQYANARAVDRHGAGLSMALDEVDADALAQIQLDEHLRAAAARAAAQMRAMPAPQQVVPRLLAAAKGRVNGGAARRP